MLALIPALLNIIMNHNEDNVTKFCEDMLSREPLDDARYSKTATATSSNYEMDERGFFGKKSKGRKVRTIESDSPMETAMDFYSRISENKVFRQPPWH